MTRVFMSLMTGFYITCAVNSDELTSNDFLIWALLH